MGGTEPFVGVEEGSSSPAGDSVGLGRRAKVASFRISTRQSLLSLPTSSEAVHPLRTAQRVSEEQPLLPGGKDTRTAASEKAGC